MNNLEKTTNKLDDSSSITDYVFGFLVSLILSVMAYLIVVNGWLQGAALVAAIMALASLQLVVQLVFFLHLGRESKPHWKSSVFWFMLLTLLIFVLASLWIMNNLNYNMMMTPEQMNEFMLEQNKKGF